jgi:hypothetical protein
VQVKYVAGDLRGGRVLWWFPYGPEFARLLSTSNRALHGRRPGRYLSQLRLLGFRRFWQRVRLLDLIWNIDKLL